MNKEISERINCEICSNPMFEMHCKIICQNWGLNGIAVIIEGR